MEISTYLLKYILDIQDGDQTSCYSYRYLLQPRVELGTSKAIHYSRHRNDFQCDRHFPYIVAEKIGLDNAQNLGRS